MRPYRDLTRLGRAEFASDRDDVAQINRIIHLPIAFGDALFIQSDLQIAGLIAQGHERQLAEPFAEHDPAGNGDDGPAILAEFGFVLLANGCQRLHACGGRAIRIDTDFAKLRQLLAAF